MRKPTKGTPCCSRKLSKIVSRCFILVFLLSSKLPIVKAFTLRSFSNIRVALTPVRAQTQLLLHNVTQFTPGVNTTIASSTAPVGTHVKQKFISFEDSMEDMNRRHLSGDKLSQEYCDSVLGSCVASDEWESVLNVLEVMKQQNITQERSTYRACLQSCFEAGNGASSSEILLAMERAFFLPEASDFALVIATMCRNNKRKHSFWKEALELLRKSTSKEMPIDAYDAVLACLVEERQWQESVWLLRDMEQWSSEETTNQTSPAPALSTYREVIECCLAANQVQQAVQVLFSMIDRDIKPTVYTFELVLSGLAKKQQWRRGLQLLNLMEELQIPTTVMAYNTVIAACAKAREVGMAKSLLSRMKKNRIQPDIITFNSVISACANSRRHKDAMNLLAQCSREPGIRPDIYTYTNVIRACAKAGKTQQALTLFQVVKDRKLVLDSYCYTAAIEACSKAKMWKKALEILDEMEEEGIAPTAVTYSVTITACGNAGQWEKALGILDLMQRQNMAINLITYNAAITALSKAAKHQSDGTLWSRALDLLQQMRQDKIAPDGFSFSAAISCCGAEGRWQEALDLIEEMQTGGPKTRPNRIAYTAAITACGRSGKYEHAQRLFRQMNSEGLSADRIAYNALFNSMRVARKADDAYKIWCEMCGKDFGIANAKADRSATPDIITLTNAVSALSYSDEQLHHTQMDKIFAEAVSRGIVLRENGLDSIWDVDLSGMSFPVARAACRYVIQRILQQVRDGAESSDLSFITGMGKGHKYGSSSVNKGREQGDSEIGTTVERTSLREYVQEILHDDFTPSIVSSVPRLAKGTVQIDKVDLDKWIRNNR